MSKKKLSQLLYSNTVDELEKYVVQSSDTSELHVVSYNYNWSNGFDVPYAIINNPHCCLSTALQLFYLCDGYRFLVEKGDIDPTLEWYKYTETLCNRILSGSFIDADIAFAIPLTKIQLAKLSKTLDESKQVLITSIEGNELAVDI
mgnify:CR=1 FL=1